MVDVIVNLIILSAMVGFAIGFYLAVKEGNKNV
jgi:uncharacterized protein YneF (UPF0154 family)